MAADRLFGAGSIVAWGGNSYGMTNVPAGLSNVVVAVAVGNDNDLALNNDGIVTGLGQWHGW